MPEPLEVQLLRKYREEVRTTRQQMRALNQHLNALTGAMTGLEALLRLRGIDPGEIEESDTDTMPSAVARAPIPRVVTTSIMSAVVATLHSGRKKLGAKELHGLLLTRGFSANYYTLYKTLDREAKKPDGAVARFGEKFGLREWATNDSGANR